MKKILPHSSTFLLALSFLFLFSSGAQAHRFPDHRWLGPLLPESGPLEDVSSETNIMSLQPESTLNQTKTSAEIYTDAMNARVKLIIYRRPLSFDYEFGVIVVDGKIDRAFIISTSMPGKTPIVGIHQLTVEVERAPRSAVDSAKKPFAFRTSATYGNSPMYWAVNIRGGYFIHSTPHYGNLGKPASMGCVRASIPDAMEIFNTVANQHAGDKSYIMIYDNVKSGSGSEGDLTLNSVLKNSGWTNAQLKTALISSKHEIEVVSTGDLSYSRGVPVDAHVRPFSGTPQLESSFPLCGDVNCWDFFQKSRAIKILNQSLVDVPGSNVTPIQ